MSCPRCKSAIVTKDGTAQLGGQQFRCSHWGRRFTRRSSSAFSGRAFPDDIIALGVRWYARYGLSYAEVSERLAERGVLVDQSTTYRWVQRFLPLFGAAARQCREPVGLDWRVDETYARVRGRWHYIYRAIDGNGQIVDAYVSPTRDIPAARSFFERAIAASGTTPHRVIADKAGTYPPALAVAVPGVLHRSGRYRTNGIERDHGFLEERLRPMRGLKSVSSAAIFMRGHALIRYIRRGFYRVVESVPQRLVCAWTWSRLAELSDMSGNAPPGLPLNTPAGGPWRPATPHRCKRTGRCQPGCCSSSKSSARRAPR
jgi:transposase, IS6 family